MKALEIARNIFEKAPASLAADWDNIGLMIGSEEKEVSRVLICLDVTAGAVNFAAENKCDMIISHHPFIFGGIKSVDYSKPLGNLIKILVENEIALYSFHTNIDAAKGGINDYLAELFGLRGASVLEANAADRSTGIGRIGSLEKSISIEELAETTKKLLHTPSVRVVKGENAIKTLAVASGSCGDLIPLAAEKGADAIITADVKYHEALAAADLGITVIDAGHYPTEAVVTNVFSSILLNLPAEVIPYNGEDVFKFI